MSHWSSRLPVCFPSQGTQVQIPGGYLCETGILLLAMYRYISDPDVSDHHCGLVWGGPRPKPSLGPRNDNVIIPLDLTQLSCSGFMLAAGLPSKGTRFKNPGGYLCETGILLLAMSRYKPLQKRFWFARDEGSAKF